MIALYVRRNADFVDDIGDDGFEVHILLGRLRNELAVVTGAGRDCAVAGKLPHSAEKCRRVAWFGHEIISAQRGTGGHYVVVEKSRQNYYVRMRAALRDAAQDFKPVELGQCQIHDEHVRRKLGDQSKSFKAVVSGSDDLHIALCGDQVLDKCTKVVVRIGNKYANFGFHNLFSSHIAKSRILLYF